jgi:hypothetical protein
MHQTTATIGRATVVIEGTDTELDPGLVIEADEYGTQETSSRVKDAYSQLKEILQDVSDDLGRTLAGKGDSGLSSVSVEFALSFTGEANVWVLKTGGQGAVKATLTWELHDT